MVESSLTTFEWLRERRNCQGYCQEFMVISFSVTIWCCVLIACGIKATEYILEKEDENSFLNGMIMSIIAFVMAAILCLWIIIIYSSIWKCIRFDKNYLNRAHDINTVFAV